LLEKENAAKDGLTKKVNSFLGVNKSVVISGDITAVNCKQVNMNLES